MTVRFVLHVHARGALAFLVRSETYAMPHAGRYRASMKIPSHLLAETIYSVTIEALVYDEAVTKFPMTAFNALAFQVFDTESSRRDVRGGVVAPDLPWTFSEQSQAARAVPASAG